MTLSGARQQWTGLPEGALLWFRLGGLMTQSDLSRHFDVDNQTLARRLASPCAERSRAFTRPRRPRPLGRGRGYLEDGVPHAEALSPASRLSQTQREISFAEFVEESALVVSALATTPEAPSM